MNKEDLERKINALDRFPGSLEEYSGFKNVSYVIMNTKRPEKFVRLDETELLSELIREGCVGLIRYNPNLVPYEVDLNVVLGVTGEIKLKKAPYGIPVKILGID